MTVIDLSEPTGYYEVKVFHHEGGAYEVVQDRGLGGLAIYEADNEDKAVGVAEFCESERRYRSGPNGEPIQNVGEPFMGSVWHWDCGCEE